MEWVDDKTVGMQYMNRLQNANDLLLGDASTGETRSAFTDRSDAWVDEGDPVVWINGGKEFTWVSEKDGWRHVFAIARDGGRERLLTKFDGDILSVEAVDAANGDLYFIASPSNPTQRYLYSSRLDGDGAIKRITPGDPAGTHVTTSRLTARAIHTFTLRRTAAHRDVSRWVTRRCARRRQRGVMKKHRAVVAQPVEF